MATTGNKLNDKQIRAKVKDLNENFLDCRDPGLRHAWMRLNDFHVMEQSVEAGSKGKIVLLGREEVCGRCDTIKRERFQVTKQGVEKIGQSYDYPQGYLMPGVPRGVTPSVIVYQEQYRRAMERVAGASAGQRETAER